MISLLLKNWKFIIDIILVIVLVALVFLWNPFGIFGGGLQLGASSNMLTEVKKIGQLVTAEYYGEVIASLDESRLQVLQEDTVEDEATAYFIDLKHSLYELFQFQQLPREERDEAYQEYKANVKELPNWRKIFIRPVNRRNILDKMKHHAPDLINNTLYAKTIEFIWREEHSKAKKKSWNPQEKHQEEVLYHLYNQITQTYKQFGQQAPEVLLAYLDEGFVYPSSFISFLNDDNLAQASKADQRAKLAMVGRGWVKAGFDFSQLDDESFYFHEESSELHFFGLEPQILNADINPWFIPEKGIPGFEIVDYNRQANFTHARQVKSYCVQKLTLYAQKASILASAQQQGESILKSFFSLLTGQEIKKIYFHHDRMLQLANQIEQDEFVDYYEALLLDSLIKRELSVIDSLNTSLTFQSNNKQLARQKKALIETSLSRLSQLPFEDQTQFFHKYSALAFRIARDKTLSPEELKELQQCRPNAEQVLHLSPLDSIAFSCWQKDIIALQMDYNNALAYIINNCQWYVYSKNNSRDTLERDQSSLAFISTLVSESDTTATAIPHPLLAQLFPYQYSGEHFQAYQKKRVLLTDTAKLIGNKTIKSDTIFMWVGKTESSDSTQKLLIPIHNMLNPILLAHYDSTLVARDIWFSHRKQSFTSLNSISSSHRLPSSQAEELSGYYSFLLNKHRQYQSRGPFAKASEWMKESIADKPGTASSFSILKATKTAKE